MFSNRLEMSTAAERLRAARAKYFQTRGTKESDLLALDSAVDSALACTADSQSYDDLATSLHVSRSNNAPALEHQASLADQQPETVLNNMLVGSAFELDEFNAGAFDERPISVPEFRSMPVESTVSKLHSDVDHAAQQAVAQLAGAVSISANSESSSALSLVENNEVTPFVNDEEDACSHSVQDNLRSPDLLGSIPNEICIDYDSDDVSQHSQSDDEDECDYVGPDEYIDGEDFSDSVTAIAPAVSSSTSAIYIPDPSPSQNVSGNQVTFESDEIHVGRPLEEAVPTAPPSNIVPAGLSASSMLLDHDELDRMFTSLLSPTELASMPKMPSNAQSVQDASVASHDPDNLTAAVLRVLPARSAAVHASPARVVQTPCDDSLYDVMDVEDVPSDVGHFEDLQSSSLGFLHDDRPADFKVDNLVGDSDEPLDVPTAYMPSIRQLSQ